MLPVNRLHAKLKYTFINTGWTVDEYDIPVVLSSEELS